MTLVCELKEKSVICHKANNVVNLNISISGRWVFCSYTHRHQELRFMHRRLGERAHVYLFILYLVQVILYDIFLLFRSYFVFNLPQIGKILQNDRAVWWSRNSWIWAKGCGVCLWDAKGGRRVAFCIVSTLGLWWRGTELILFVCLFSFYYYLYLIIQRKPIQSFPLVSG